VKKLALSLLFFFSLSALADNKVGRVDLSWGFFSLNGKAAKESTSVSGPTAFVFSYHKPLLPHWEFNGGYSLLLADLSGSDMGYGFNLGVNYLLFQDWAENTEKMNAFKISEIKTWIPFVGLGFYQRSFESIKNSFAGFGVNGGTEKVMSKTMNLKVEVRYINLSGSSQTTATEMDLLLGLVFKF
jgi:hypothetical protein